MQRIAIKNVPSQQIGVTNALEIVRGDPYEGEYTVVPSALKQILQTKDKLLRENVVVAPIPRNYGLITYNGFELTVS